MTRYFRFLAKVDRVNGNSRMPYGVKGRGLSSETKIRLPDIWKKEAS